MSLHVLKETQSWGGYRTYMEHNTITLSVVDWSKFNPRTDSKKHTWFRFENEFFIKTSLWTNTQRQAFIYVCCQVSQAKTEDVQIDLTLAGFLLKQDPQELYTDLNTLNEKGFLVLKSNFKLLQSNLKLHESNLKLGSRETVPTIRNGTKRNETKTNADNAPRSLTFDFEIVYQTYPKKEGKSRGLRICNAQIKTQKDYEDLRAAVANYGSYCQKTVADSKFIKHFSTFMGEWRDWIDKIIVPKNGVEIWAEEQARKERENEV